MTKALLGILVTVIAGLGIAGAIAYSGLVDVGADAPHAPVVFDVIEMVRERSIARRLDGIVPPADRDAAARVRLGAGNYEAMCAGCHLRPGERDSELRAGLYPKPPALAMKPKNGKANPARAFWIIKHGLKASGMPAWGKGGMRDADIWSLVGFLDRLPGLSPEAYRSLQAESMGHSHAGSEVRTADHHDNHEHSHDPGR
ncbi:MAG: cytochrome c [Gammaproteobacteria bacterium]|nr:cytochrome c [Gammaproteobacteria bacterium]MBU1646486.1 cytochrome c [Gammaproteobacteria bacterium]MBU1971029.1 cytochrome c [Gammaproteobacteria bacterium]